MSGIAGQTRTPGKQTLAFWNTVSSSSKIHQVCEAGGTRQDTVPVAPPLHIKLGLMKEFEKALDKQRHCFLMGERFYEDIKIMETRYQG